MIFAPFTSMHWTGSRVSSIWRPDPEVFRKPQTEVTRQEMVFQKETYLALIFDRTQTVFYKHPIRISSKKKHENLSTNSFSDEPNFDFSDRIFVPYS